MSRTARATIPGLEVLLTQRQGPIPVTDPNRIRAIDNIIDRALLVLESARGRSVLSQLGQQILTNATYPCLYPDTDPNFNYMDYYVGLFLQLMREAFPVVVVEVMLGPESEFIRADWAVTRSRLEDFVPRNSGTMLIDYDILHEIITTRNNADRDMYTFLMIISATHEIVHCFTGYLTGNARARTPDEVSVDGHLGESGYGWEAAAFGGLVTMWGDPQLGTNQPGIPYLFPDHGSGTAARRVSSRYIENFISGDRGISLPIQVSTRETPRTSENAASVRFSEDRGGFVGDRAVTSDSC